MAWGAYWVNEKEEERIRGIISELSDLYMLPFDERSIQIFAGNVYREFCLPDNQVTRSRTFEEAQKLIEFFDIRPDAKGEITIKHSTGSFKMGEHFLQILKDSITDDYADAMNDAALWGDAEERKVQIRHQADQEHRDKVYSLKQSINRLIAWLKGMEIFTTGLKTVSNKEGAFLYDLLFGIEKELKHEIFTKAKKEKTPPNKLDNATKRKIIASYLN